GMTHSGNFTNQFASVRIPDGNSIFRSDHSEDASPICPKLQMGDWTVGGKGAIKHASAAVSDRYVVALANPLFGGRDQAAAESGRVNRGVARCILRNSRRRQRLPALDIPKLCVF